MQTFAVYQITEKYGTLRLYVEFDHDDDLPAELRIAEPRCPSFEVLAERLGMTGASRDGSVGDAWQNGHETIFVPAHEEWSARVAAFRGSDAGMLAAEDQARRSRRALLRGGAHAVVRRQVRRLPRTWLDPRVGVAGVAWPDAAGVNAPSA